MRIQWRVRTYVTMDTEDGRAADIICYGLSKRDVENDLLEVAKRVAARKCFEEFTIRHKTIHEPRARYIWKVD